MTQTDFMIDYPLFLINECGFERNEATENAKSWWNFFEKTNDRIKSFRLNRKGNPSIQTHLKKIEIDEI